MKESDFQRNMGAAKAFIEITDHPQNQYWTGYQRGLRRHHHGESFRTPEEHEKWLALADNHDGDDGRRFGGLGYRDGFDGLPIAEAIERSQSIGREE